MQFGIEPARPPYIEFEQRAVEDREATIAAGHIVYKNIDFVIVRQIGSVNTVEKQAEEWLNDQKNLSEKGRIPREWLDHYRKRFEEYQAGLEPSVNGTSIRLWPGISKADVENCIRLKILTVEDLAEINDDTMQRLGMGAMALKQKARAYLDASNKPAEELAALRQKTVDQDATIEELRQKIAELEADRPKRGRAA